MPTFLSNIKGQLKHFGPNVTRDWLFLLVLSGILLSGIVVWNIWIFQRIASGGSISTTNTPTTPLFNPSSLTTIQELFAHRTAEEAKFISGEYHFSDPSQ